MCDIIRHVALIVGFGVGVGVGVGFDYVERGTGYLCWSNIIILIIVRDGVTVGAGGVCNNRIHIIFFLDYNFGFIIIRK